MFQPNGLSGSVSYTDSTPPSSGTNSGNFLGVAAAVGSTSHHQHPVYVPSNRAMMGGLPQHHHHPQYSPSGGPTSNSHHFVGGSTSSASSWHHQAGASDSYMTAASHHHHHHHLGAGAPHHQTPLSSPFYAQNAMMMSSWRAYDSTGFQRTSPYGTPAEAPVVTESVSSLVD
jgi:hypothetical protein